MWAVLLAGAASLAGCDFEQVIDLPMPAYEPRLVVGAFPTPDSVFTARVGRTVSALDSGPRYQGRLLVRNARVALLAEDGTWLDSLRYVPGAWEGQGGMYRSARGLAPTPGAAYRLVVEAPGYPAVRAATVLPEPVPFTATLLGEHAGEYGERRYRIAVSFVDPPGARTYHLRIAQAVALDDGATRQSPLSFESTDPILRRGFAELDEGVDFDFEPGGRRYPFYNGALFRNATFAGEPRTITLEARTYGGGFYNLAAGSPTPQLTVTLSTLSADYTRYQQTLALQDRSGDNPFVEPVPLHSNVEGGHGVFAGYAEHAAVVEEP